MSTGMRGEMEGRTRGSETRTMCQNPRQKITQKKTIGGGLYIHVVSDRSKQRAGRREQDRPNHEGKDDAHDDVQNEDVVPEILTIPRSLPINKPITTRKPRIEPNALDPIRSKPNIIRERPRLL